LTGQWLPLYLAFGLSVAIGEAIVVFILGWPLLIALRRLGLAERLGE
jgi:hypothetical protein